MQQYYVRVSEMRKIKQNVKKTGMVLHILRGNLDKNAEYIIRQIKKKKTCEGYT